LNWFTTKTIKKIQWTYIIVWIWRFLKYIFIALAILRKITTPKLIYICLFFRSWLLSWHWRKRIFCIKAINWLIILAIYLFLWRIYKCTSSKRIILNIVWLNFNLILVLIFYLFLINKSWGLILLLRFF
jgi:hypothetical protein